MLLSIEVLVERGWLVESEVMPVPPASQDRVEFERVIPWKRAYWEVPAGEPTAIHGRWVEGPGEELFRAPESALGELAIIAENQWKPYAANSASPEWPFSSSH
jgi:hypothetical protein